MKQFELTLVWHDDHRDFTAKMVEKVESDDLVELLARFVVVIATVQQRIFEEDIRKLQGGDDVPF